MNEQEPMFLKGHTARSGREMSPVRVVKNPDGSMQRAALTQTALAKERREIRRQQERSELEAVPQDISKPWEDPLAHSDRCATVSTAGSSPVAHPSARSATAEKARLHTEQ